jgi:hypothetical protein
VTHEPLSIFIWASTVPNAFRHEIAHGRHEVILFALETYGRLQPLTPKIMDRMRIYVAHFHKTRDPVEFSAHNSGLIRHRWVRELSTMRARALVHCLGACAGHVSAIGYRIHLHVALVKMVKARPQPLTVSRQNGKSKASNVNGFSSSSCHTQECARIPCSLNCLNHL